MSASVKQLVELKRRRLSSKQQRQPNTALGQAGENRAISYLLSHNYLIKDRNIVFPYGELDIVAFDVTNQELVFVEVKTRTHNRVVHPSLSVNWKKRRALVSAALSYLKLRLEYTDFRFDVITISPQGISHFQNIFLE